MSIKNLVQKVEDSNTSRSGKYESMLTRDESEILNEFVSWLKTLDKPLSDASSNSYRSYVAKALALDLAWSQMSSDVRSGVRKFNQFLMEIHPELLEDDDEDTI